MQRRAAGDFWSRALARAAEEAAPGPPQGAGAAAKIAGAGAVAEVGDAGAVRAVVPKDANPPRCAPPSPALGAITVGRPESVSAPGRATVRPASGPTLRAAQRPR